jgi:predicted membrane protein
VLDLRNTKLTPGDHRVNLKLGIGGIEVFVPKDVCVSTNAHLGAGGLQVFDRESGGGDVQWQDLHSAPATTKRLIVDADIGIGGLRVEPHNHGMYAGNLACTGG